MRLENQGLRIRSWKQGLKLWREWSCKGVALDATIWAWNQQNYKRNSLLVRANNFSGPGSLNQKLSNKMFECPCPNCCFQTKFSNVLAKIVTFKQNFRMSLPKLSLSNKIFECPCQNCHFETKFSNVLCEIVTFKQNFRMSFVKLSLSNKIFECPL